MKWKYRSFHSDNLSVFKNVFISYKNKLITTYLLTGFLKIKSPCPCIGNFE